MAQRGKGRTSRTGRTRSRQITDYRLQLAKIFQFWTIARQRMGLFLIVVGCGLFVGLGVYRALWGQDVSFAVPPSALTNVGATVGAGHSTVGMRPTAIVIDKVHINLPIYEAQIVNGKWQVTNLGGNHWNESALLGEKGNVVIYGHNWRSLFGPIQGLRVGDEIHVTGENQQIYTYTITQTVTVNPTEVQWVLPTPEAQLTVYTCTGPFDSQRFVVVAKSIGSDQESVGSD